MQNVYTKTEAKILDNGVSGVYTIGKKDQKEEKEMATRKERLEKCGWTIHAALDDRMFVAETNQGDWEVLYFYIDGLDETPMVEGYFTSSLSNKAIDMLYDKPYEFLKEFYFHCVNSIPDWYMKEDGFYK